ncbi:formate C-acetyltransferase [Sediminispirochaeta smaragdinae]|uniref:Formate acetyltransferase n=1 Tax=Sediminispirochaeta smaragdinae (strain DSM 11293 / JCM 15392 / SEBR 4228) TaxID=573413 RepID=E1R7A1_SEDSS|nr:formate C-acetyltransferase [Sediminispirochaeta smaragdinae]ADK82606.1 formate acetyltransferase [Sediminispirochaeta smaragdinae DSM 11293]
MEQWKDFNTGNWNNKVDIRDFIQRNIVPYEGDASFLSPATERTKKLWEKASKLIQEESQKGILDAETNIPSTVISHKPGYLDKEDELIVGFQTDKPLKRGIMPRGGLRVVKKALTAHGYELAPEVEKIFSTYRKTHNDGVFSAYSSEIRKARHSGILTGLPDAYGRGRIIGDYRRVALYGIDFLINEKKKSFAALKTPIIDEEVIRKREEISEQIQSLNDLKTMASMYGFDLSLPAGNAREAIQWTYFAYLAAIKDQDGAAMSLGRVSSFFDIYIERDFTRGILTEAEAQELMDQFVMKLRMVRFLRTPEYDELFSGDPTWVTESIGGMGVDGRTLVSKNSFRMLHTLENLGPAPEPNMTVLWTPRLPLGFRNYCTKVSIDTSAIQYENDCLMRTYFGDDYGIACCVSAMKLGKQMQFFGARANLAKALLYAINGGKDEKTGDQIAPKYEAIVSEYLDYDEVMEKYNVMLEWLANLYIKTLNIIHFMHDKYNYESLQMALHDDTVVRTMACGIAGLSVVADSLSAIKYAKVKVIRNESGLAVDYEVEGDYPAFGNNDDRVDLIANNLVEQFMEKLRNQKTYRNAEPTQSILTITSNVVYGKKTGATPDGRKAGAPFGPGANPLHGRDTNGALACFSSIAKLPYEHAIDGISYTFSIVPQALGKDEQNSVNNLTSLLDGFFLDGGHHVNINVLNRETLLDAMDHPEKYPQLTIRVSGYAVNFVKLTREQQLDVINRTFHDIL